MWSQVLVPLVGGTMSSSSCGLRGSKGSLSANGWDCIPTQLVVWPEVSQYRCLQAGGWEWGWVLRLKSWRENFKMVLTSTYVRMVEQAPQNGSCQCLCYHGKSQLLPATLGDTPRSAGRSDLGSFQTTTSALSVRDFVCSL